MKNKVLFILLTLVLTLSAIAPSFAQVEPAEVAAEAGEVVVIEFKLDDITGFNGTLSCTDDASIIENIVLDAGDHNDGLLFNEANGMIMYYGPVDVDLVITLTVTIAATAKSGDECTINFEYEIPDEDALLPSDPVYSYESAKIYILDYTELRAQIAAADTYDEDKYTAESWSAMIEKLDAAKALDGNAKTQDEIDNAAELLKKAIEALELKPTQTVLDYTKLQAQVDAADALMPNEKEYTEGSWKAMMDAYEAAKALLPNKADTQEQINTAAENLKDAIAALKKLDYSELDEQISDAESKIEKDYTEESWGVMLAALGSARSARTDARTQEEVDAAAKALRNAINALVKLDYLALEEQIARTKTLEPESYYTEDSWAAMTDALDKANAILGNARTQEAIDSAAAALKAAIDGLVKKSDAPTLNFAELDKFIAEAKAKDKTKYTPETWDEMVKALEAAINTRNNATTQEEIDNASKSLKEAIVALVLIDSETGDSSMMLVVLVVSLALGLAYLVISKRKIIVR